jgi:hypothetical protein
MAYIGRGTESISNVEVLDNLTFNGSASYTLQKSSVNFVPSSANNLLISISGVVQQGNFSVSGSTITFDTTVSASDTCDWILHYGTGLITTVADGAITEAKLGSSAVTTAKINNGAITSAKLDSGLALGKIGQVVSSTYSTNTQTTSSTFADTGHSASITPSSTSSKVLIMLTYKFGVQRPSNGNKDAGYGIRLLRGSSTNVVTWDEGGTGAYYNFRENTNVQDQRMVNSLSWVDSPSSTSSQTYKIQHNCYSASGTVGRYARDGAQCILILMEVLA